MTSIKILLRNVWRVQNQVIRICSARPLPQSWSCSVEPMIFFLYQRQKLV
uniref:Uncharacterized protein n=1 Tax=Lepeophtheirus salmonis TaxID=72036 RepID=A0A0K2UZR9_LEPSM